MRKLGKYLTSGVLFLFWCRDLLWEGLLIKTKVCYGNFLWELLKVNLLSLWKGQLHSCYEKGGEKSSRAELESRGDPCCCPHEKDGSDSSLGGWERLVLSYHKHELYTWTLQVAASLVFCNSHRQSKSDHWCIWSSFFTVAGACFILVESKLWSPAFVFKVVWCFLF